MTPWTARYATIRCFVLGHDWAPVYAATQRPQIPYPTGGRICQRCDLRERGEDANG